MTTSFQDPQKVHLCDHSLVVLNLHCLLHRPQPIDCLHWLLVQRFIHFLCNLLRHLRLQHLQSVGIFHRGRSEHILRSDETNGLPKAVDFESDVSDGCWDLDHICVCGCELIHFRECSAEVLEDPGRIVPSSRHCRRTNQM